MEYNNPSEMKFFGETDHYYGVELEVAQVNNEDKKAMDKLQDTEYSELFYLKRESAPSAIEICSFPMSLDFWRTTGWDVLYRMMVEIDGADKVHLNGCGMHIHANGLSKKDKAKLVVLFSLWNNELKVLSRRTPSGFRWCPPIESENTFRSALSGITCNGSKGHTLTGNHSGNTLECRMFQAVMTRHEYISNIELYDLLIRTAENHSLSEIFTVMPNNLLPLIEASREMYPTLYNVASMELGSKTFTDNKAITKRFVKNARETLLHFIDREDLEIVCA